MFELIDDRMTHSAVYDFLHWQGIHARYEYDGLGRRAVTHSKDGILPQQTTRSFYNGLSLNKLSEWEISKNSFFASRAKSKQYYYAQGYALGAGDVTGITRSDGITSQSRYFSKDALGSVKEELGQDTSLQSYRYDAFGNPQNIGYHQSIERGFTAKPFDGITGLSDYGYRDYSPRIARFTTVDPIRDGENWYVYVNGDPVNHIDPNGLFWNPVVAGVGALIGSAVSISAVVVADVLTGNISTMGTYLGAVVGGAAAGAILSTTYNSVLAGAAGAAAGNTVTQLIDNGGFNNFDKSELLFTTTTGGTLGLIPGAKISSITSGRGSMLAVAKQVDTKLTNKTISTITNKTASKVAISRLTEGAFLEGTIIGTALNKIVEFPLSNKPKKGS